MGRIISIHEYDLKPGISAEQFEHALRDAEARGLLQLPGLVAHHFVKGAKGVRSGAYAAVWIYESREAWEHLWGTPAHPRPTRKAATRRTTVRSIGRRKRTRSPLDTLTP